jgi:hypothetical protein
MCPFNLNLSLSGGSILCDITKIVIQPTMIIIHLSVIDNILGLTNIFRKIGGRISTSKMVLIITFQVYLAPETCVRI